MHWLIGLICFASGCVSSLAVVRFFLRRYMVSLESYVKVQNEHREKFQQLISQVYHKDQIPKTKRIRGLTNLGLPATIRLLNWLDLLKKENHHGYAKFAIDDAQEILQYWRLAQQVSLELEENVIKNVKEFEHYQ